MPTIKESTRAFEGLDRAIRRTNDSMREGINLARGTGGGGGGTGFTSDRSRPFNQPHQPTEVFNKPSPITSIWNQQANEMLVRMANAMEKVANNTSGGGGGNTELELMRQNLV